MTPEQRAEYRAACNKLLANSGEKAHTLKSKSVVYAFWVGVIASQVANKQEPDAFIGLNLMAGTVDRLMKEEK